ncbi:MAG: hypothetical protein R3F11_13370 [Verrucomicrobiales bacterium]
MNNKHLACTLIGGLIALMLWGTLQMFKKQGLKVQEAQNAKQVAESTKVACGAAKAALEVVDNNSRDLRDYLSQWDIELRDQTFEVAQAKMEQQISGQNTQLTFLRRDTADRKPFSKDGYVRETVNANLTLEDDFVKSLAWLGDTEATMITSRVHSCRIKKGQAADRIHMEITIMTPIVDGAGNKKS